MRILTQNPALLLLILIYFREVNVLFIRYKVEKSKNHAGAYVAYAVHDPGDGEISIAEFFGPKSKQLAEEFAESKNSEGRWIES